MLNRLEGFACVHSFFLFVFQGYYCPPGQSVPNPYDFLCPVGHYCLEGSPNPTRCDSGFYQNEEGRAACKRCPEGNQTAVVASVKHHASVELKSLVCRFARVEDADVSVTTKQVGKM